MAGDGNETANVHYDVVMARRYRLETSGCPENDDSYPAGAVGS
jgi:hypothetical protein